MIYFTRSLFTSRCMTPALLDDSTSIQADSTTPFGLSTDSNRPPSRAAIAVSQTWSNEQPDDVIGLSASVRHPGTRHKRDTTMRAGRTIDVISKRRGILTSALLKSKASAGTQRRLLSRTAFGPGHTGGRAPAAGHAIRSMWRRTARGHHC